MKTIFYVFSLLLLFIIPNISNAQFYSVSGYIKDSVTERGIVNVSDFEDISGIGTISNDNGYYRLILNPGQTKLIISKPGFKSFSTTFELKKDTVISANLDSEPFPGSKIVVENDVPKKADSTKTKSSTSKASEK
jgi:hypothetical protein